MVFGLREWLSSLMTLRSCGTQPPKDCCDYDLPAPRLILNRLPITRPSTPCSSPTPELYSAVPSLDHLSAPRTSAQMPLLELLPLEIRQKIWALVLGGQTYQLGIESNYWEPDYLSSTRCLCADLDKCPGWCSWREEREKRSLLDGRHRPPFKMGNSLRLLTVCRQVYTEAIDIMYSSNIFVVRHTRDMEYLPLTILPQRMNAIRNLRLTCDFSGRPPINLCDCDWAKGNKWERILPVRQKKWENMWNILSNMTGLRQLYVKLHVGDNWATINLDSAAVLLEPVKQVTRPELFVLTLPFPAMYEGMPPVNSRMPGKAINGWEGFDPWDDLPNCKIRRISQDELWAT
ncbi:hypothetical protein VTL71DRAFT_13152 [Oculimacula yallundae]|uniref:DUF7730 domain-containing protein n=1 Tax=Oculimacula yallundae TaxID=86028 RepID=A0ABR4CPJ7_9HELO